MILRIVVAHDAEALYSMGQPAQLIARVLILKMKHDEPPTMYNGVRPRSCNLKLPWV